MNDKQQVRVGVGIMILRDGKVLLGLRKGAHGEGEYSFPGGGLEYGESITDCAKREVKEECGIDIDTIRFIHVANELDYPPKHFINIAVMADIVKGEPEVCEVDKCEKWEWFNFDELPDNLFAMTRKAIESYQTGTQFHDS